MRYLKFIFMGCFLFLTVKSTSQTKVVEQVLDRLKAQQTCWNNGDLDGYLNFYAPTDSVRMIYSGGVVQGRDNIASFFKKYWPKERMGVLTMTDFVVEPLSKKSVFVSAKFSVASPNGKNSAGYFSGIMQKINGLWYLYIDHSG
ncbi:Ketosteroid isomerase homolog [Flavobacterium chilense]|uniref:Ketosteroid isomerase homolog n=2 Tax=Flavobacterium chilense TaxID=946677 RepID=A0A1M7DTV1_9FLAO|nr:Ketosteroid isomerase homolog [Flavobacterium chilense]